ncbi:MAG: rRNA maturation RNase YbeY [Alphaproteobacteria bacterium]|nr:rRNA maturation RNase YbeY [Alphaproteobacteria bacterium]MDA8003723.1 rRNA maturation RNase YbeY [Alphaproteobacteria bacterium]MDA8005146.1 rRNA maturation RNase YbeY [Alphaproteobacteria bacterium]MDA8013044.1 rRNA maturation RNase YbeY [Alphaproteobacteria bacterium]
MKRGLKLELVVTAPAWNEITDAPPRRHIRRAALAALDTAAAPPNVSLSVMLAGRQRLRALNREFRNTDLSTDILAFPAAAARDLKDDRDSAVFIGDLALSHEELRKTAGQFNASPCEQLAHLIVHGVLHLLGHDHDIPARARRMRRLESEALARLSLPDPWTADARRSLQHQSEIRTQALQ